MRNACRMAAFHPIFCEKLMLVLMITAVLLICVIYMNHRSASIASHEARSVSRMLPITPVDFSQYQKRLDDVIAAVPSFKANVDCGGVVGSNDTAVQAAEQWTFDENLFMEGFYKYTDRCEAISKTFLFLDSPLSLEEYEYPLAYGLLVHSDAVQVMLLLGSVYQPQNQYCIAVSSSADEQFQTQMFELMECFPNIFVTLTQPVKWCEYSVLQGVLECVHYLTKLKADWKYYQYLSGVDLPLKTNLEMVRIFKKLNGSFNAGIHDLEGERYRQGKEAPLPLWKSSLSATFSRESAEFLISNSKIRELRDYLKGTMCPDETFWATVAGNPDHIPMPGGFNASLWKEKLTGEWDKLYATNNTVLLTAKAGYDLFQPEKYYISRYQIWHGDACAGTFTGFSCAYGVKDLAALVKRPELVAHKLYFSVQPATYFCLYETVRRRAFLGNTDFNVDAYAELPGPKLLAGTPFEELLFNAPQGFKFY
ncbi:hypothetical protein QR680_016351 [Steinernema hermaphroditum]|uniref:Protein xylosyltransferase n=1 Tax=Steinernema hermaphroditum TaxID=289476 RepID=A0AA39LMF9_9BILA|nr:hypothetical protein QR680_016351 [Steinernema hermaphroditum]